MAGLPSGRALPFTGWTSPARRLLTIVDCWMGIVPSFGKPFRLSTAISFVCTVIMGEKVQSLLRGRMFWPSLCLGTRQWSMQPVDRSIPTFWPRQESPTPARLHRFRMAPSSVCRVCSHPVATLDHLFKRCPKARRLRLPLRRILLALYEPVLPSNVTLWSAPFLPCLSRCRPASFVVWCFIVIYWRFHLSHSLPAIISIIAANIRQAIVADWHSARRHRPPAVEFFRSQWMPPGRPWHVCCVD